MVLVLRELSDEGTHHEAINNALPWGSGNSARCSWDAARLLFSLPNVNVTKYLRILTVNFNRIPYVRIKRCQITFSHDFENFRFGYDRRYGFNRYDNDKTIFTEFLVHELWRLKRVFPLKTLKIINQVRQFGFDFSRKSMLFYSLCEFTIQ